MNFPHINSISQYPTIFFGSYFIPDGGKPIDFYVQCPIEWLVLEMDEKKGRALLLSKHILDREGFADCPIFGHGYKTSWDESYLRNWLNDEFIQESFSPDEQEMIFPIYNAASQGNGKRTIDKVFLLSAEEVKRYFSHAETAIALESTIFAAGRAGNKDKPIELSYNRHIWWTRTSGATKDMVVCVSWEGSLCEQDSNSTEIGVRPAVWIKWNPSAKESDKKVTSEKRSKYINDKNNPSKGSEKPTMIVMTDDQGNDIRFEIFDTLEYQNEEYAFFLVEGGNWEEDGFLIVKIVPENDAVSYIPVGEENKRNDLFDIFFERHPI